MLRSVLPILMACSLAVPALAQPVATSGASTAERRQAFEDQLDDIRSKISADERQLQQNRTQETATVRLLTRLNRDIALREEIVRTFEGRIVQLENERDSIYTQVQEMGERIEALKEEYRARATHAYKYGRLHDLALILSASSINQMLVRVQYLQRFSDDRTQQVERIRTTTTDLENRREQLLETLAHTEQTLREAQQERERLFDQKRQRQRVVRDLRRDSGRLESRLAERRQAETDLSDQLSALIAEERRRAAANASGFSTAEFEALTGSFESNQGRLPWPAGGTVIERFGVQVNEEYGTRTTNQGIVVATAAGVDVHSVFEGRVIGIDVMPVYGRYVMVSHGDYVSVYGNLSTVYVTPQQTLTAGQLVGKAGTEQEPYGAGYFFGLSKDGFVDPASWLRRQ